MSARAPLTPEQIELLKQAAQAAGQPSYPPSAGGSWWDQNPMPSGSLGNVGVQPPSATPFANINDLPGWQVNEPPGGGGGHPQVQHIVVINGQTYSLSPSQYFYGNWRELGGQTPWEVEHPGMYTPPPEMMLPLTPWQMPVVGNWREWENVRTPAFGTVTPGQPGQGGTGSQAYWSLPPNERQAWLRMLQSGEAFLPPGWTLNPSPQPMTAGGATAGGAGGSYSDQALQAILAKYPATNEGIQQAIQEANRTFGTNINILQHPSRLDKIQLPDGRVVDVIMGATGTSGSWGWIPETGAGSSGGYQGAPYTGVFTGGGQYPLSSVYGEGFMRPWDAPFFRPTAESMQSEPGWQFRMQEGLKAIERAGAAKGTLLTGGTMKALNSWAQDYASGEYDKVYNRALGEYQQAYGIYNNNLNTLWGRLGTLAAPGLSASQTQANMATGYGNTLADLYGAAGNATATGQATSGSIWGGAMNNLGNIAAGTVPYWWPGGAQTPEEYAKRYGYFPGSYSNPTYQPGYRFVGQ